MSDADFTPKMRNARACEACRASKSRCIYKSEAGICQRCEQGGNKCVVRAKARPMRTPAVRTMSPASSGSPVTKDSEFTLSLPSITSPDVVGEFDALHEHHKKFFGDAVLGAKELIGATASSKQTCHIEQREVTLADAEQLLEKYRLRASSFPFVRIETDTTVRTLSRVSPFLLLAILTSASIQDPKLYHQMDHEFRRVLSLKVIVEGCKSLDFLQGLLVYLAWYPHHVNPKKNQSYIYTNLAIGLITDLGLDHERPDSNIFSVVDTDGLVKSGYFTTAAKRAYLGCYYLSSALSMGFQKPNNLQHRDLMDIHGQSLMQEELSAVTSSAVKLQRLTERVRETHVEKLPATNSHMDSFNIELNIQVFQNELQDWRRSTPEFERTRAFIGLADRFVELIIYSYALGLFERPYRDHLRTSVLPVNLKHLSSCLNTCKTFFEYLLSLQESLYLNFTVVQWGQLVQSTLVLSRLTFIMAANLGWDPDTTRSNVPLVMYLDCLCYRFQQISSTSAEEPSGTNEPDIFYFLKMVLGSVKTTFQRRVAQIDPTIFATDLGNMSGIAKGHCPIMDPSLNMFFNPPNSMYGGSSGTTTNGSQFSSTAPIYHDLWATMTGNWAEESQIDQAS